MIGSILLVSQISEKDIKFKTCSARKLTKTTSNQKVSLKKLFLELFFIYELTFAVKILSKLF